MRYAVKIHHVLKFKCQNNSFKSNSLYLQNINALQHQRLKWSHHFFFWVRVIRVLDTNCKTYYRTELIGSQRKRETQESAQDQNHIPSRCINNDKR